MSSFIVGGLFDVAGKLIDRLWPDPAQRDKAKLELMQMQQNGELAVMQTEMAMAQGQMETNKVEAASSSMFVAGWRPGAGWMCVAGLSYSFVIRPLLGATLAILDKPVMLPPLDSNELMALITGMLGFGVYRSYEKTKGVATNTI